MENLQWMVSKWQLLLKMNKGKTLWQGSSKNRQHTASKWHIRSFPIRYCGQACTTSVVSFWDLMKCRLSHSSLQPQAVADSQDTKESMTPSAVIRIGLMNSVIFAVRDLRLSIVWLDWWPALVKDSFAACYTFDGESSNQPNRYRAFNVIRQDAYAIISRSEQDQPCDCCCLWWVQ